MSTIKLDTDNCQHEFRFKNKVTYYEEGVITRPDHTKNVQQLPVDYDSFYCVKCLTRVKMVQE